MDFETMSSKTSLLLLRFLLPTGLSALSFFLRPFFGFGSAMKIPLLNSGSESSSVHCCVRKDYSNAPHNYEPGGAGMWALLPVNEREIGQIRWHVGRLKWTDVRRMLTSSVVQFQTFVYSRFTQCS